MTAHSSLEFDSGPNGKTQPTAIRNAAFIFESDRGNVNRMNPRINFNEWILNLALILASLTIGCNIPTFYSWTESDQSRPSPLLWQIPLAMSVAACLFAIALPWLPIQRASPSDETATSDRKLTFNFRLKTLIGMTTAAGIGLAFAINFPVMASGIFALLVLTWCLWLATKRNELRWPLAALVACLFLPYAWLLTHQSSSVPPLLVFGLALPGFVPGAILARLFDLRINDPNSIWLPNLVTLAELMLGVWVVRLGPKRSTLYLLFVLHVSVIGSLTMLMLVLM